MRITIRSIGNRKSIVLPKPLLAQVGLSDATTAEITVEDDAVVLRRPVRLLRAGWAEAAAALAAQGDAALVMGEFGNEADAKSDW